MAKSDKLYKDSPKMERDGTTGKVSVKKQPKDEGSDMAKEPSKADKEDMGLDAEGSKPGEQSTDKISLVHHHSHERVNLHHRHVTEHLAMHSRHEHEHAMAGETDKKILHKKHEAEHKAMQEQHHEELKTMHRRHEKSAKGSSEETKQAGTEASKIEKVD